MAKWSIDGLNLVRLRLKWIRSFSEGVPHSCASSIWPVLICCSAARCAVVAHLWLWREIMNSTGDLLRTCQNFSGEDGGENLSSPDLNCEQSLQLNRPGIIRVRRVKQDLRCQDPTLWLHCVGNSSSLVQSVASFCSHIRSDTSFSSRCNKHKIQSVVAAQPRFLL